MQKAQNLQDQFLNQARKDKIQLTIFLMNGVQMKGLVRGFDNFVVMFDSLGKQQMIYKHAISTVIPASAIDLASLSKDDETDE
ncbi:MAG: RNA chaperone Hfq [Oscillospiraceae bacterium]|jgi:host factor-I protein|nr:RNA chaperone Hfq [Oscillospiraceae bacterium]